MRINEFKKTKIRGIVLLFALLILLCSCTNTPPEDAEELIFSESFGIEGSDDNGPDFDDTVYTPTKGLKYSLSSDKSYYIVSGIGKAVGKEIVIPSEYNSKPVKKIGERALSSGRFTSIVIPDSITDIGDEAFYSCRYLKQVVGARGVCIIGSKAFENCRSLTEFTVYKDMTKISGDAFYNCYALREIKVTPANPAFTSINGDLYTKDGKTLLKYAVGKQDESYTVSDTVSEIGTYAFAGAYFLSEIEFGTGVTKIGDGAFYSSGIKELHLPDTVREIGSSAFSYCSSLTSVNTGGARKIADGAFARCRRLREAVVGESAEELGGHLFYCCTLLRSVTIGASVDKIGAYTFGECDYLKEVWLGGGKKIDSYAFYNCKSLESIDIPDEVEEIGYQAFYGCNNLYDINFGESLIIIGKYAFCRTDIRKLTLPEGLVSIGDSAFAACGNLREITIPDSVEFIGDYAFCGCTELESAVIGKGVKDIGASAFSECIALADVKYRGSAEEFKLIVIGKYNNAVTDLNVKYNYKE